jgi:prepilin-type N-terminal cleavage/methylation domain-containing protein
MLERKYKIPTKGFTLLELILVMIILCTVLAMASPSLRGFFSSRQINNVAEQIMAITRYAKINSVSSCAYYRVFFDPAEGRYWVSALKEGEYVRLENNFGRSFVIPSDIKIKFENVARQGGLYYVEYSPEGYCKECNLRLEDDKGNIIDLSCYSPSEEFVLVKVENDYAAQRHNKI